MMVEWVVCLDVVKFLASHYFYKKMNYKLENTKYKNV